MKRKKGKNNKPKVKPRSQTKRAATEKEILEMARQYREMYPGDTPEQIRAARLLVHEKMSKYSNADYIYRRLREYGSDEDYSSTDTPALVPFGPEVFPGYVPTYEYPGGNVNGYSPNSDAWVPDGYTGIYDNLASIDFNNPNFYQPDFVNSFMYYYDPLLPKAFTTSDDTEDTDDTIVSDSDLFSDYEYEYHPLEPPVVDLVEQKFNLTDKDLDDNDEMLYDQYNYFKGTNTFNYLDPRIGEFMDKFRLNPDLLHDILRDRYRSEITLQEPVAEADPSLRLESPELLHDSNLNIRSRHTADDIFLVPTNKGRKRLVGPMTRDLFLILQDLEAIGQKRGDYTQLPIWSTILDEIYNTGDSPTLRSMLNNQTLDSSK